MDIKDLATNFDKRFAAIDFAYFLQGTRQEGVRDGRG
jgi:hypothetical protein